MQRDAPGLDKGTQTNTSSERHVHYAENWCLHSCWPVLALCTLIAFWIEALSARRLSSQQKVLEHLLSSTLKASRCMSIPHIQQGLLCQVPGRLGDRFITAIILPDPCQKLTSLCLFWMLSFLTNDHFDELNPGADCACPYEGDGRCVIWKLCSVWYKQPNACTANAMLNALNTNQACSCMDS